MRHRLLSVSADAKTIKGEAAGYLTGILYLAPSDESGVINVCANASVGCRLACLYTAGRGAMPSVKKGRMRKTLEFVDNRSKFMNDIVFDIKVLELVAADMGKKLCIRLNGTSDLPWENILINGGRNIFDTFPDVQFYDYTKSFTRMVKFIRKEMPANYHLTFSRSEENGEDCERVLSMGGSVATVFVGVDKKGKRKRLKELPTQHVGRVVADGDKNDLRFLDKPGQVIGLVAKGKAVKDESGFAIVVNV
jgi:hypothetical protein